MFSSSDVFATASFRSNSNGLFTYDANVTGGLDVLDAVRAVPLNGVPTSSACGQTALANVTSSQFQQSVLLTRFEIVVDRIPAALCLKRARVGLPESVVAVLGCQLTEAQRRACAPPSIAQCRNQELACLPGFSDGTVALAGGDGPASSLVVPFSKAGQRLVSWNVSLGVCPSLLLSF